MSLGSSELRARHEARRLHFEGARNVRDLGGLPVRGGAQVRRGVVFRSDGLSRLTDADLDALQALGLRTVIDLRFDEERQKAPSRLPAAAPIRSVSRAMLPRGSLEMFAAVNEGAADADAAFGMMCANYARMPYEHAQDFGAVIRCLIAPGAAPHLIHCTSGKDRTGVAVALVLLAVGVDVEDVVMDYELSNVEHQPVDVFGPRARPDAVRVVMSAHGDFIRSTIEAVERRSGSIERYLAAEMGLGEPEQSALRALLVDAPG